MRFIIFIALLCFTVVSFADIVPKLLFLGTVDGKGYYYTNTTGRWEAGRVFCETYGYKFATVRNAAQFNLLKNSAIFRPALYWLDGRESSLIRRFLWDEDKSPITNELTLGSNPPRYLMVAFNAPTNVESTRLGSRQYADSYRYLCEESI